MRGRGEEPAVVLVDTEVILALADHGEQRPQVAVEVVRAQAEDAAGVDVAGQLPALREQAVRTVVRVLHGQQPPGLRVEAEQQPIEEDQGVVEGDGQRLRRALVVAQQSLGDQGDGGEDLALQRVAHPHRVGAAVAEGPVEEAAAIDVLDEGRGGEERGEVGEGRRVVLLEQGDEIHLVARALDQIALRRIQAPQAAVGQDAPPALGDRDVVDDLRDGVVAVVASPPTAVERAIEPLGIGHRDREVVPGPALEPVGLRPPLVAEEERVIGLAPAGRRGQTCLDRVGEAQRREHRLDQPLLGLGLVGR